MATRPVKLDVPDDVYQELKSRADASGRSFFEEAIELLRHSLDPSVREPVSIRLMQFDLPEDLYVRLEAASKLAVRPFNVEVIERLREALHTPPPTDP